jgi:DnaJ-class molecular chaperone
MKGFENNERPCPTCQGKGVVIVRENKADPSTGKVGASETKHVCPTCRGSKKSSGIATK